MAKVDTTEWEQGGFFGKCDGCGKEEVRHRQFYYPTFFNGDAECLKSFCEECYQNEKDEIRLQNNVGE